MPETEVKVVALPAVLDLDALDGVRDRLLEALDVNTIQVDGHAIERIATNGLIMLLCAAETAHRSGHAFEIVDASGPMLTAIDRLGLRPGFGDSLKGH